MKSLILAIAPVLALTAPDHAIANDTAEPVWTTLGTNSGPIPDPDRSQPANVLRYGGHTILVDVGDGAVEQLGKAGVPFEKVDTLFVSHHHFDHTGGLFSLIGRRWQVVAPGVLTIYGPPGTKAIVDDLVAGVEAATIAAGVVKARTTRSPADTVRVVEIGDGSTVSIGEIAVTAASNSHYAVLADGAPDPRPVSLSLRFDMAGESIVYTGDTGPSANVEKLATGADILISEIIDPDAAIAELRSARPDIPETVVQAVYQHHMHEHLTPANVGKLAARARVKALVITHNPIKADALPAAMAEIETEYSGPTVFAADLDNF